MIKRYVTALLAFLLILGWCLPAFAAETQGVEEKQALAIESEADFLDFAENCRLDSYSWDLTVELKRDLDLTGREFSGIPIFCGTFLGNGYTIRGIRMESDGSVLGLFRYLTDTARVENLHLQIAMEPGGSRSAIGGIAGENAGTIVECTVAGQIQGADQVGGIAGRNTVSGIIENCRMDGSITGNHFLGGIAGENAGVIRNCENAACINTTPQENQVELTEVTLDTLSHSESAATVTDLGGIAGTSTGVLRECINRGQVGYRNMGYNVGGIVGSQSGTVLDCENHAQVRGRKEVGGIVGHLKPAALIEYEKDALQILQGQLDAIGGTVSRTSATVQETAYSITDKMTQMGDAIQDAQDSLSILMPDGDDPALPDPDTLEAARNGITDSIWEMTDALERMSIITQGSMSALSANLMTLQQQVATMSVTLGNVTQSLGGTIEDVSDQDTDADLTGKIAGCENTGSVKADLNAGGIVGAVALESELDGASQLEILGQQSLNFISKVRAVVRDCSNTGTVSDVKQNVGGIVGFHSLGLVRQCENTGDVGSTGADYVGGIAGRSSGYLRQSDVKALLTGDSCVGGIAGSGAIVTDCRSMVQIEEATEQYGAVIGILETAAPETEDPLRGNLYSIQREDPGGIDGVSYQGKAEGLQQQEFQRVTNLDPMFKTVTIRFCFEDGQVVTRRVKTGQELTAARIPEIPRKEGYTACWKGLEEADLSQIWFDMYFDAEYISKISVIATEQMRGQQPLLLMEGSFAETGGISLFGTNHRPELAEGLYLAECWEVRFDNSGVATWGRVLVPQTQADVWHILVQTQDGTWEERTCRTEDSYLIFGMDGTETALAIAGENKPVWYWYAAGTGVLALGIVLIVLKKRK